MDFIQWIGFGVLAFLLITHFGIHFFLKWNKKRKRALKKQQANK
jgi:preprotein translocase subunit YajC